MRDAANPGTPSWVRALHADGWANIFDVLPEPRRLTGVDSYCGDWSARTLVLGKDCAPARVFRRRLAEGMGDPYRHDPNLPTNKMLRAVLESVGIEAPLDGSRASMCGVFYANAYFLLRDDDRFSGALPNRRAALAESKKVLRFILENQPNLERIIAMGEDAYAALADLFGFSGEWRRDLEGRRHRKADRWEIVASSHLGSRGVRNRAPGESIDACKRLILDDWRAAFGA